MLPPISITAASASTRSFGFAAEQGERKQLMEGEHLGLDRKPALLFAEQLRDQRQIEPLACAGGAIGDLRDDLIAQWPKVNSLKRHRRQPGKADPIRKGRGHKTCNHLPAHAPWHASAKFSSVHVREQPLDPGNDRTDIGDLALYILPRDIPHRLTMPP